MVEHSSGYDVPAKIPAPRRADEGTALVGDSAPMEALRREIDSAARSGAKVLVLGETGSGKEIVARLIHARGARRGRPFVPVNCSGIPETLLESELFGHIRGSFTGAFRDKVGLVRTADRGTLFLDELGEMSLRMQAMLLRFAETGEIQPIGADGPTGLVDVRLVTATNCDLRERIADREFRMDLYYRLNVIEIRVPPLRERGGDIPSLLQYFLRKASDAHKLPIPGVTAGAEQLLVAYSWPGNVRELKNVTERLVVRHLGRSVAPGDLPVEIRDGHLEFAKSSKPLTLDVAVREPDLVEVLWQRMMAGEDFWSTVHRRFRAHDLTRDDLRALIRRGLEKTHGSYRALVLLFHMHPSDYKRFLAFLYQHECQLPFLPHRAARAARPVHRARRLEAAS